MWGKKKKTSMKSKRLAEVFEADMVEALMKTFMIEQINRKKINRI